MAKHAEEKKHNFLLILFIILFLVIIVLIAYTQFNNTDINSSINTTTANTIINHTSNTFKTFENASHLYSDKFNLSVENGISTINGKIFNTSDEVITDLNCLYTLKDINNNIVYDFSINVKELQPQSSFGFTSVSIIDLSNVTDYSVKINI